jgi:hypothetical protein
MTTKRSRLDEIRRIMAEGRVILPGYDVREIWRETRDLNDLVHARDRWGECIETVGVEVKP